MEIDLVKVKPSDIQLGKPLPFSIFTLESMLLLKKGTIVASMLQLNFLLERGVYRNLTEQEVHEREISKGDRKKLQSNPFACIYFCVDKLSAILHAVVSQQISNASIEIQKLAELLKTVVILDPNAALGAIHLMHTTSYSVTHAIYTAILSGLLARRRNLSDSETDIIICAALTMNTSILDLQDQLYEQASPLTVDQRRQIDAHPELSAQLLQQAGIDSAPWLQIVMQHHEKNDSSGYPKHLAGDSVCEGAKIIALADIYTSLITGRKHRSPILANEAIKALFAKRGGEIDEQLANQFIREIGVYPPGTFIQLINSEIGVITKRAVVKNNKVSGPFALSFISPRGAKYHQPYNRDCSIDMFKIQSAVEPSAKDHLDVKAESLWGY